jgi:hypothetical protein
MPMWGKLSVWHGELTTQCMNPFWYSWFIDDVRIEKRNGVGISENSNSSKFDFEIMPNPVANTLNIKTQGKMTKQF